MTRLRRCDEHSSMRKQRLGTDSNYGNLNGGTDLAADLFNTYANSGSHSIVPIGTD